MTLNLTNLPQIFNKFAAKILNFAVKILNFAAKVLEFAAQP